MRKQAASGLLYAALALVSEGLSLQAPPQSLLNEDSVFDQNAEIREVEENWAQAVRRAQEHVKSLSLDDKISLLHGQDADMGYVGYVNAKKHTLGKDDVVIVRDTEHSKAAEKAHASKSSKHSGKHHLKRVHSLLEVHALNDTNIELRMQDGGQGFRTHGDNTPITATQFPGLLGLASTFNVAASKEYGEALAEEFVNKGANVVLGPELDIARVPHSGRTFESLSGEDPYLGATLVKPYIRAVQSRGIIAVMKHFQNNNHESARHWTNVEVSDRTQHELYLPPFKAGIEAGAGGVMCSYNKVYGHYACENPKLLKEFLREDLGFKGFVISDWGGVYDAIRSAKNGLDIEMTGSHNPNYHFKHLQLHLRNGNVAQEDIDTMATHVLSAMYAAGQFDTHIPKPMALGANVRTDQHLKVAKEVALDGAVLLKNDKDVLPLTPKGKTIALLGKHCDWHGGHENWAGPRDDVYMGGGSGYVRAKPVTPLEAFQSKWAGATIKLSQDASAATGADVAIICAGSHGSEGDDRDDIKLGQAQELAMTARKNIGAGKVVMLALAPGMFTTEWLGDVDAALVMFVPGEVVGPAAADLLDGTSNPGGRLPVSLPNLNEQRFTRQQWPGHITHRVTVVKNQVVQKAAAKGVKGASQQAMYSEEYSEGSLVGYRWYDAEGGKAAFPFGFGLSYTKFQIWDIQKTTAGSSVEVTVRVKNIGTRAGSTVPQLYVSFPSMKPVLRQLRGFSKVYLKPGTDRLVKFQLDEDAFRYYDETAKRWQSVLNREDITISVGDNSADLHLKTVLKH